MLQDIKDKITAAAERYGVSPALALAVAQTESGFNPAAVSPVGAQGVFQLMPATARGLGVSDPFDPDQNIDGGVRMLAGLDRQYSGDLPSILAAYNWGSGNLASGRTMPAETRNYIAKITGLLGLGAGEPETAGDAGDDAGDYEASAFLPSPDLLVEASIALGASAALWLLFKALFRRS